MDEHNNDEGKYSERKGHSPLSKEETKNALKEAINDWLDAKYNQLGRFTFGLFLMCLLCALLWFVSMFHGWNVLKPS